MKKSLITLISLCCTLCFAQSGPAGVGNSTTNTVWLDANELNYLNGDNVSVVSDFSGNGNDFTQLSSVKQPVFITAAVNGFPVLRFDGVATDMLSSSIPALESSSLTYFIVYKQHVAKTSCFLGANFGSNTIKWFSYALPNGKVRNAHFSPTYETIDFFDNLSSYNFISTEFAPTTLSVFKEGNLVQTKNTGYTAGTNHNFLTIGSFPDQTTNNKYLDGDIAEIIIYNSLITDVQRVIIENYLGAKYNKTIAEDYYSYQGTHKYGVIGIGDNSVNSHTASTGKGILTLENPGGLNANEYMFIGHKGDDLSLTENGDMPVAASTHHRWSRTWIVDETGELGNVTLRFNVDPVLGFAYPNTYNLLIDDDGDFSNSVLVTGVYNAGTKEMVFTTNLSDGDHITLSGLLILPIAIHSVQSGSWTTGSTWDCNCIPSISDTVYVEPTHIVHLNEDVFVHNLNIVAGGTLKVSQDFNVSLYGDAEINGAVDFTDGDFTIAGNIGQEINGDGMSHDFHNIVVENTSLNDVVFTNGNFVLNATLTPNNGSMVIDNAGGGSFTVNSTSGNTSGRIGIMNPSFSITGDVTVKRFLPAGVADERTISSPVIGANLSEWDSDIEISGTGFPDGCAFSGGGCYFSCKRYNGGSFAGSYIDVTNPNEPLENGTGYELFLGDDLNTFSGATLSSTGGLRDHNDFSIVSPQIKPGWNIMGNPYASPISFNAIVTSHIGNYFYIYDAATGSYQWYDGSSNTSSIPEFNNGILAIGQGVWIFGGGVPSINFKQLQKTSSIGTFIRSSQVDKSFNLELTQEGTTYKNVVNVDFNEEAFDGKDSLDMKAFTIGSQKSSSIFISLDEGLLAKNYLNTDGRDKIVDLSVKILNDDYYTITATNLENVLNYTNITLVDLATNELIDLRKTGYTFYAIEDDETRERFQLILSNETLGDGNNSFFSTSIEGIDITQIGNAIDINSDEEINGVSQVLVTNLLGQDVLFTESLQIQKGVNMVYLPEELKGFYLVTVRSSIGVVTKKIIL